MKGRKDEGKKGCLYFCLGLPEQSCHWVLSTANLLFVGIQGSVRHLFHFLWPQMVRLGQSPTQLLRFQSCACHSMWLSSPQPPNAFIYSIETSHEQHCYYETRNTKNRIYLWMTSMCPGYASTVDMSAFLGQAVIFHLDEVFLGEKRTHPEKSNLGTWMKHTEGWQAGAGPAQSKSQFAIFPHKGRVT